MDYLDDSFKKLVNLTIEEYIYMGKENTSFDGNEIIGKIRRIRGDSSKLEQPSGCGQLGTVPSCYLAQELDFLGFNWNGLLVWTRSLVENGRMSQE